MLYLHSHFRRRKKRKKEKSTMFGVITGASVHFMSIGRPHSERLQLQELQAVKGKVEQLTAERDVALSENVIVRQQRDCHADHAQLLVKENKRLVSQLQALRLQLSQSAAVQHVNSIKSQACTKQQENRRIATKTGYLNQVTDAEASENSGRDEQALCKSFHGNDVKNRLHRKPFDLSKGSVRKEHISSKAILMQAQQLRVAQQL